MALKTYNPVTSAQRQLVLVDRTGLHAGKPVKALTEGKNSTGGRNNNGHITSRYRGGGHKQAYRKIDFKRRKFDVPAKVERLEYDPNRTGFIALVKYEDGELANSGEQRLVHGRCIATIGAVSNPDNMNVSIGKAGRTRWMGRRGHVRGEAMNPVDHPLGGRTRGGRHPVTPWGKPTKGMKTRKNKRTAKFIMASRHARKQK